MPYLTLKQMYPAMDEHPPKWVRSADGTTYEPDWSDYPEDAPRWQVSHTDPVMGFTFLTLADAEVDAERAEVLADVDDSEPDINTSASEDPETNAHDGGAPDPA